MDLVNNNEIPLGANQLDNSSFDIIILNDDRLPGPVKQIWGTLRTKELYLIQQNKLNTVYINDYQQRDTNNELSNYINYTWQNLQMYNLPNNILMIFKNKLLNLSKLIKYR
jgi:hypothetical protein